MRISWARAVLVAAWLLHACGDPATGDDTGASSSTGSSAGSSSGETNPPATTIDEGSSGAAPTTSADSTGDATATTGPGPASSEAGSSEGETNGTCEPPPPAGDLCLECVVANCCTQWVACQSDEACACVLDCHVVQGNSLGMCASQCNSDNELYQAVFFCGQMSCLGTCEWDCC